MTGIEALFKNRKLKVERLLPFGFAERGEKYVYSTPLVDGQLEMTVTVTKEGEVSSEVRDAASKESYVLHRVSDARGAFVGAVREEYKSVLAAVAEACFELEIFKSEDAGRVIRYVREKYRDELQFLWKRFPDNAIFRRQDNAKWYAALLTVQKQKLGLDGDDPIEILDLRGSPEDIAALVDGKSYFPGWHMNKKHWFTICLDGSIPPEEIFRRIDESFALAAK